jgi:hypothetical protein
MKTYYRTNLDNVREIDQLNQNPPNYTPARGDLFQFSLYNGRGFQLEVTGATYIVARDTLEIELHIPRYMQMSVYDWQEYIKNQRRAVGGPA